MYYAAVEFRLPRRALGFRSRDSAFRSYAAEITQMDYRVPRLHSAIPSHDELLITALATEFPIFFRLPIAFIVQVPGHPRAAAVLIDVGMTEVEIGSEESLAHLISVIATSTVYELSQSVFRFVRVMRSS